MCRRGTDAAARTIAALGVMALGAALGGCSNLYLARRGAIAPFAGNAIAANNALQTVDPWPRLSGNPNFPFNGQRMQAAVQRYREGKVAKAVDPEQGATAGSAQNVTQISVGGGSTGAASSSP